MITGNPEKARGFFAAKTAFTTGPVELTGMLDRKQPVTVVDVRRPEDYAKRHIPGAVTCPTARGTRLRICRRTSCTSSTVIRRPAISPPRPRSNSLRRATA